MDSMRTLNKSLPRSSRSQHPPEELLLAFKEAATSVTKLYKQTHAEVDKAQQAGYQEAIGDLLSFLDRQRLGLDDGEGWEVRKWATERLDSSIPVNMVGTGNESEEEKEGDGPALNLSQVARSSAPPESSPSARRRSSTSRSPPRAVSATGPPPLGQHQHPTQFKSDVFTFQTSHPYSHDTDMQVQEATSELPSQPTVRVEVHSRAIRQSPRQNSRFTPKGALRVGPGAGTKRKAPLVDFFDMNGIVEARDTTPTKRFRGAPS